MSTTQSLQLCLPPVPARASTKALGDWGEDVAAKFLEQTGYRICERNWRQSAGELDIIAVSDRRDALIAVEVKTRRSYSSVPADEAISAHKYRRLCRLLHAWLRTHKETASNIAIDQIAITLENDGTIRLIHSEALS